MFKEMYNYELTLKLWTRMSDNANTILQFIEMVWSDNVVPVSTEFRARLSTKVVFYKWTDQWSVQTFKIKFDSFDWALFQFIEIYLEAIKYASPFNGFN